MTRLDDIRDHLTRSHLNLSLAEAHRAALGSQYPDWEIVIRFYTALHLVQAYLTSKNHRFHASKHHERLRAIRDSPELMRGGKFLRSYRMLQDVSEQVRYEAGFVARPEDLEFARGNLGLVQSVLESKIAAKLGSPKTH